MARFVGSLVLLSLFLWVSWLTISQFVESRYTEQLRNHLEALSSAIDHWPGSETQDDKTRPEPDKAGSDANYAPCPSPAAAALCNMIRQAHYDYEGRSAAPWLSAGARVSGYFFLFNENLDGIVHGAEPAKYEHSHTEIKTKYPENFDSIAKLQEEALKGPGQIHCINYDWKPISNDEKEAKLGCVKQVKTALIPTRDFRLSSRFCGWIQDGYERDQGECLSSRA
jgi:hypothetical protein